jgi:hypothetical protein
MKRDLTCKCNEHNHALEDKTIFEKVAGLFVVEDEVLMLLF